MLPGEFIGESAAAERSGVEIVSRPRSEHNARSGAIKRESSLVNTINEGRRAAVRERRSVEGREKMVIRQRDAKKGTKVPFERSCLLLVFDVSEEIMPRGM